MFKNRKHSDETKKKISKAKKGFKHTEEAKHKMSEEAKERFKNIENHPMYGKHHTVESLKKISQANSGENHPMYGKHHTVESLKKISQANSGEKNHQWKGGITPENLKIRQSIKYSDWRTNVFKRDDYKCRTCGSRELECHHISKFSDFPALRFIKNNGISLCKKCHSVTKNIEEVFERLFDAMNYIKGEVKIDK